MIYLREREVGFDQTGVGFPSIDGCHAIVLDTPSGLYGFHNLGGSGDSSFAERSQSFADFVTKHFCYDNSPTHLYGICFRHKRGYQGGNKDKVWKREMKAFANALGYTGKISGFNLDLSGLGQDSAYVQYKKIGGKTSIFYKRWNDVTPQTNNLSNLVNHKTTLQGKARNISGNQTNVISSVSINTGYLTPVQANDMNSFTA